MKEICTKCEQCLYGKDLCIFELCTAPRGVRINCNYARYNGDLKGYMAYEHGKIPVPMWVGE